MKNIHNNIKETEESNLPLWFYKTRHGIYYVLSVIEVLLAFRFLFKLLGANPENGFVSFMYTMAGIFAAPFSGIFDSFVSPGLSAKSVFEPSVIIGMIVYAILARGLVGLVLLKAAKSN